MVNGMPFGLTPEWHVFYWQIMGLLILMLPLKAAMVLPSLRRVRGWLQLAVNAMGILILVVMVQVRSFFVAGTDISAGTLKSLAGINGGITLGFKIALAVLPRPGPPTSRHFRRVANVSSGNSTKLQ